MKRSHGMRVVLGAALVLTLAACGGTGTAAPTSSSTSTSTSKPTVTASASPTPSATPTPEAATADTILVLPNLIGVRDGEAPLADYDYFTPLATITAGLTEYFGFDPVVAHVDTEPGADGVSYTEYVWEGFSVRDWDGAGSPDPYRPEFQVYSEVAAVRGIAIVTAGNSKVGDATDAVAAANADARTYSGEGGVAFTTIRVAPMEPVNGRFGPISLAVRLDGRVGGVIEFMQSPWPDRQM